MRTSTAIASSRQGRTKRCRDTSSSCPSPAVSRTSSAKFKPVVNSQKGWAFYGEEMFVQLGLFGDDLDARYFTAQWERVRGARAIVDPELASGAWTVDQAVQFFAHQTGFSPEQAKAAIASIALEPGYVIAYTSGRAQLEALLAEYWAKAGAGASLRDFHDRLLCYGSTPFSVVGPELLADLAKPLAEVRAGAGY